MARDLINTVISKISELEFKYSLNTARDLINTVISKISELDYKDTS